VDRDFYGGPGRVDDGGVRVTPEDREVRVKPTASMPQGRGTLKGVKGNSYFLRREKKGLCHSLRGKWGGEALPRVRKKDIRQRGGDSGERLLYPFALRDVPWEGGANALGSGPNSLGKGDW